MEKSELTKEKLLAALDKPRKTKAVFGPPSCSSPPASSLRSLARAKATYLVQFASMPACAHQTPSRFDRDFFLNRPPPLVWIVLGRSRR